MEQTKQRKLWHIVLYVLVAEVVILLVSYYIAQQVTGAGARWVGGKRLPVQFFISDAATLQPIVGASVTVFDGPMAPPELRLDINNPVDFSTAQEITVAGIADFE